MLKALTLTSGTDLFLHKIDGQPMPQELMAIQAYAQPGFYNIMNVVLKNLNDNEFIKHVPEKVMKLIRLAASGLRKIKVYNQKVYRGETKSLPQDKIDKEMTYSKTDRAAKWNSMWGSELNYNNKFVSTSKRPYTSYIPKKGYWFAVNIENIKTGVDISAISGKASEEREVLFPPGAKFHVNSIEDEMKKGNNDANEKKYDETPLDDSTEYGRIKVNLSEK